MYKAFFGMVNTPFSRKVPPEALYSSQAMDECLGRMKYVVERRILSGAGDTVFEDIAV